MGVHLWKEFRRGELDFRELLPCPLDYRLFSGSCFTTLVSSRALTFCCPLYAITTVYFSLPLAGAAPEAGFLSCLSREEKCFSRIFWSRDSLFEQYLDSTETAMASAVLTVEGDGRKKSRISSSGCFFIAIAC